MKQFSLPLYILKFFLYLIISLILHMFLVFTAAILVGGYESLIVMIIATAVFPLGLWNFFFFLKVLSPEQSSEFLVGLVSILFQPIISIIFLGFCRGFSLPLTISFFSDNLFYIFGMIVSNTSVYLLAHLINFYNCKKKAIYEGKVD